MKKKIFLPAGIAACLAVGIISTVSADTNVETAAYVKDVVDSDNAVFESLLMNIEKASSSSESLDYSDEESADLSEITDEAAYLPALASVSFDSPSDSVSEVSSETPDNESEDSLYETNTGLADIAVADETDGEETFTAESIIEDINENIITTVDSSDHTDDSKELNELENEIKPPTGQSPDDDNKAFDDTSEDVVSTQQEEEAHEHEWTPVTEIVHHDSKTHTEEVWITVCDNNKSFSYEDEDYNTLCSVYIHGTIVEYRDDEIFSVEGEEEAGIVDITNHLTGESYTFAPGELDSIDSFVRGMVDFESVSALVGPAWGYVEEVEIVDEEAYDEEVITGYVCDCGEDKSL